MTQWNDLYTVYSGDIIGFDDPLYGWDYNFAFDVSNYFNLFKPE